MDAIEYFTRNRHSDYPEVVFSSILSNLLDPKVEICFRDELLRYIYDAITEKGRYDSKKPFIVKSEHKLGEKGSVDIFIDSSEDITAIEVKIWDRSANNISVNEEPQLIRYADVINSYSKEWRLIFVVPTIDSPICLREYKSAFERYPRNIFLLSWNPGEHTETGPVAEHILPESILDIILKLKEKSLQNEISQWILTSLINSIPTLVQEIPDIGKFPDKEYLKNNSVLWPLFQLFFSHFKRWPNRNQTTVGIPYGYGDKKSLFHGNSLFRIRTTREYYSKKEDIDLHLPQSILELEIWEDVFLLGKDEFEKYAQDNGIRIKKGKHLDSNNNIDVVIMSIPLSTQISNIDIDELHRIMVVAFEDASKK